MRAQSGVNLRQRVVYVRACQQCHTYLLFSPATTAATVFCTTFTNTWLCKDASTCICLLCVCVCVYIYMGLQESVAAKWTTATSYYTAPPLVTRRLQAVMNAAARLICGLKRLDHIMPVVRDELYWFPVSQNVGYKVALLIYKCLHRTSPAYVTDYCIALTEANLHH